LILTNKPCNESEFYQCNQEGNIFLYRLTNESIWIEGSTNASSPDDSSNGQEVYGHSAGDGEPTWNHRVNATDLWNTPGGDIVALSSGSAFVNTVDGSLVIIETSSIESDVISWFEGSSNNNGWMIAGDEGIANKMIRFGSHENGGNEPLLEITYQGIYILYDYITFQLFCLFKCFLLYSTSNLSINNMK